MRKHRTVRDVRGRGYDVGGGTRVGHARLGGRAQGAGGGVILLQSGIDGNVARRSRRRSSSRTRSWRVRSTCSTARLPSAALQRRDLPHRYRRSGFGALVHAPAFQAHPQFELVAIASPRNARAIAENGIFRSRSIRSSDLAGTDLDAVVASSPLDHHHGRADRAGAGKHVPVREALYAHLSQAEEIAAAARTPARVRDRARVPLVRRGTRSTSWSQRKSGPCGKSRVMRFRTNCARRPGARVRGGIEAHAPAAGGASVRARTRSTPPTGSPAASRSRARVPAHRPPEASRRAGSVSQRRLRRRVRPARLR